MQRADSRTPPGRHRRPKRSDRVVLGLKIATFLVVAGLVGVVLLVVTGGADNHPAADRSPAIPKITPSRVPSSPAAPDETSASPVIEAPELQTQTEVIVAAPPPPTVAPPSPPPPAPPPPPQQRLDFAVIGERCDDPGSFSITREQEPVMCVPSSRGSARWREMF